jgi:hypothetical protein
MHRPVAHAVPTPRRARRVDAHRRDGSGIARRGDTTKTIKTT